jgi:putative aldouronate transport system permease protein
MKASFGEKCFYAINYIVLVVIGLSCFVPLVHIASLSLSDNDSIISGLVTLWPRGFSLEAYYALFRGTNIMSAFFNSVIITVVGVVLSMATTIFMAYPLSRSYFVWRRAFTLATVFTLMFGGGIIPTYLVVKNLGLINTYGSLWLVGLISTYNMLVMKTSFENIPDEVEEAARIDGCNEWRLLFQIVLPLCLPLLATIGLFYAVHYWNLFLSVLIYINKPPMYNMSVLVQQIIQSQQIMNEIVTSGEVVEVMPESIKAAGVFVLMLPMLAIYPFLQKYFVKGVMVGAIKG